MLVYLDMRKGDAKRKIEVRAFSGYTLKNKYKSNDKRDLVIERLFIESNRKKRGYRWFSVIPRDRNILFQIADQLGPRIGNTIRGVLAPLNAPFQKLIRVLFDRKLVWMGSPSAFWQATTYIVSMVYKQSYTVLTSKGGLDPSQAKQIAISAARIFCNFMLTTRLTYQLANYAAGLEQPEELSEDELREIERAEAEEAQSGEASGVDPVQLNMTTKYIISAFRKLRLQQILEGLKGMEYRLIAYTFVVNDSGAKNINWVRYARGSHAYSEIIIALTDIIVENVDEVLGATASGAAAAEVAARKKKQHRSYSEDMTYEDEIMNFKEFDEEEQNDYIYDEYDDEYEYNDEEEYDDDYEYDTEDEYDDDYEYDTEDEYDDDYEYDTEDEYDDDYEYDTEDEDGDFIEPVVEPEMTDYELTEPGQSTMIEPVDDETERAEELVEAIKAIEPSMKSYRLAEKFLRTRTFSNSVTLKRKFYDFLVNEFVNTRAFNKKEKEEMEEAAAEMVDKLDAIAEDVKDMKTMLAKVVEAMDVATEGGDEGGEEESKDSESSWEDFWRSDDSYESEDEGGEEEEADESEEETDKVESDDEEAEEGKEGYRNYYARLRKYKKRKLRMAKEAAKPKRKPKAKGI